MRYVSRAGDRAAGVVRDFLQLQSAGGILLMVATAVALVLANTRAEGLYHVFLDTPVSFQVGTFTLAKPLLLWINDGLMAVFFFVVGLEIKGEVMEGALADRSQIALPALAAAGGMATPALIYWWMAHGDPVAADGWAIPAATDIAFTLGVLSLLGSRVPRSLKVLLMTLAILDDLGAIVIIALVYTERLSVTSLAVAAIAVALMAGFNAARVRAIPPYFFVGLMLWVAMLKSGIHATLAGVVVALFVPMRTADPDVPSPLRQLEQDLHPLVAFAIMPLFAFANAGVSLRGLSVGLFLEPVPLGIALGLLVGKTVGVFGMCAATIRLGIARMPESTDWRTLFGGSILCGIGFTMSLFIANLAFAETAPALAVKAVLGVLVGSLLAAVIGYVVLAATLPREAALAVAPRRA